ncbi:MAG TPA: ABC transporter permease [Candidatus Acidoferrum sp.]|jgi:putative ABC transport system permease protein|nr:ABC transporter permease [Candidatus Acidoferrum sp.]
MHIREAVAVAVDALRANKVRAVLTSIGVIIGSASIVLVVTVALTSQKFVISQIEAMGSNLVWVEMVKTPEKAQPLSYEINTDDLAAARAQIPDALIVDGFNDLPMAVVVSGRTRPVRLIGVTDGYQQIRRLIIVRGRYFDFEDMESRSKVCLITKDLADRVFGVENPVGRQLHMGELTFTVIGVFRERAETFGLSELQKESVIIPFSLMKYYTGTDVLSTLQLQTGGPEKVAMVEKQLSRLLKSRHPPQAEYNVQTLTAILGAAKTISLALRILLILIAFIALLISGIGIMNIMLVTVTERTREIGVRKAIGAAQKEIMWQFLIEAFLISGGGAVIGILIGVGIPVIAQQLLPGNLRVPISPMSVVLAFLVSCSTGLFFGWLPAKQAAALEPIESLRYE